MSKRQLIAITADAAGGASHRDLLKKYPDVSERTVRVLRENGVSVAEWKDSVAQTLRSTVDETIAAYRAALAGGKVPASNLAIAAAIMIDKIDKLDAKHAVGAMQVNLQINDYGSSRTKEEILAALNPQTGQSLLAESVGTPEYIP